MTSGRFAPSPTGALHLGNLRTALLAWLFARSTEGAFLVRMEDLDRTQASAAHERRQLADLAALGLDWDGEVVRQSERFDRYEAAIATLDAAGSTYPCYCTRREIRDAASAPHSAVAPLPPAPAVPADPLVPGGSGGPAVPDVSVAPGAPAAPARRGGQQDLRPEGAYPGTCRELTAAERSERERSGRPPALRLRGTGTPLTVEDDLLGPVTAVVDDVVLRRNDGVPAYNLAVVVDDAAQGVEQVVRGDDLAPSAPRQRHLGELLGLPAVSYAHVPLVLGPTGRRLAKRDGAVTLADQAAWGTPAGAVLGLLAAGLGLAEPGERPSSTDLLTRFDPTRLPTGPWTIPAEVAHGPGRP